MVLNELNGGGEVGLVELVGNVPAERAELAPLLDGGVHEGGAVEHGLPAGDVGDVEHLLGDRGVGALQAGLDALRRLVGELDGGLEEVDGELGIGLGGDPAAELFVDHFGCQDCVQELFQEAETQVTVLQQDPAALCHSLLQQASGMHLELKRVENFFSVFLQKEVI